MVQSHGCLHLVPPLPARAASAVPFLTAILQERGIFQPEPVVPRSSPHRFHQRIPLKRVCCSCLSPLWHAAIVRLGWAGVKRGGLRTFTAVRPPVTVSASRRYTIGAFRVSSPHPRDYMDLGAPLPFRARPPRL